MRYTALIVPAWSNLASQARIVSAPGRVERALVEYRENPAAWRDVGIMNSRGELVCCENHGTLRAELLACAPLAAGYVIEYEAGEVHD